jgi:transmembrane sensor
MGLLSRKKMSSEQIEQAAALWLARRDQGSWSAAEQAGLGEWLCASTAHRVAFLRLEAAWQQAARLKALGAGVTHGQIPPPGAWPHARFFDGKPDEAAPLAAQTGKPVKPLKLRRWRYGLAVSLLIAVLGGLGWYIRGSGGSSYETVIGGLEAVPLADGSNITLNSDSEVHVAVTEKERRVVLTHGEAFFEVAKDPARPFVVRAGHARIIAVGTRFSVRRDGDDVSVVVIEGRVRMERDEKAAATLPATLLAAGNIARSDAAGVLVEEKPLPVAEEILSWRSGFLVFHDTPLATAVAEFNRYNTRKIVIEDPTLAQLRIGGHFRSTNVEAFVRLLESGLPLRAEQRQDQIILRGP